MTDPLGLIGATDAFNRALPPLADVARNRSGPGFKEVLQNQIEKVNELQRDATAAIEDLAAGRSDDIEGVLIATEKADTAFRLLLQVRNKVLDAYEEVKQMRV